MKKVLIVTNMFHASPRIPGLVKYLPEHGWEPVILCSPLGNNPDARFGPPNKFREKNHVIETPYNTPFERVKKLFGLGVDRDIREQITSSSIFAGRKKVVDWMLTRFGEVINFPDSEKHWKAAALKAAEGILKIGNIDALLSSSSPVTSHVIAGQIKKKWGIPWLADLRDLWSQNHNYYYSLARKALDRKIETATLRHADAIVTVSRPWAEKLSLLHERNEVFTITNGFDYADFRGSNNTLTTKYTITYTGHTYWGKQNTLLFLDAVKQSLNEGIISPKYLDIRFYGTYGSQWEALIKDYGLEDCLHFYGLVPRKESFAVQKESQLLLIFNWDDKHEKGWYPLKSFEYLGAGRPIIVVGGMGGDVLEDLLSETGSGFYCTSVNDMKKVLEFTYREFLHTGEVPYSGIAEKIGLFSYAEMAKKFSKILTMISSK